MARRTQQRASGRNAELVGCDFARVRVSPPGRQRFSGILLIAALIAGLGLAALRIDILRLRYALAEAVESEQTLLEEQSVWTARSATLADPTRLTELAEERGFERPARVIELHPVRMAASLRP